MKGSGNKTWLAKRLGVSSARVSQLIGGGRIKDKKTYTEADVQKTKAHLTEARAANNATSGDLEESGDEAAIQALSRNPERIARIKLVIERTAKIKLERELLAGGYLKKEDVEKDRLARVYSIRAKLQEIPLRASLIAMKTEAECERILSDWAREVCDYYANGGN